MISCSLLSLATAVPGNVIAQADAKAIAREAFGRKALFDRLAGVFDNAAIATRHTVAPIEWYAEPHGWSDRNAVYLEAAERLFEEAAALAIERAGLKPGDIDGVVTVSTTGIATPSLEARVGPRLGLRPDVRRVPIFGLGCAGGIGGLATAARLAASEPGTRWLFVTVETCSISIRLDSDDPAAIVATALFGDGAAAAVVGTDGPAIAHIAGAAEKLWPDTQRIMGWDIEDPGLAVVFDRAIPPFIERELAPALDGDARLARPHPRRHRPLLLPSGRGEGDRRDRDRARPAAGRARPRARGAPRFRQHERARPCCSCSNGWSSAGFRSVR